MCSTLTVAARHLSISLAPWLLPLILPLVGLRPQCINEEGFRLFLKTYLEVEDFPADLCQRLFRSFQNSEAAQEDSASEIRRLVLTRLSGSTRGPYQLRQEPCAAQIRSSVSSPSALPQRKSSSRMSRVTSPSWRTASRGTSWSVRASCSFSYSPLPTPTAAAALSLLPLSLLSSPPVAFKLYDRDGNGVLDSSVSSSPWVSEVRH